MQDLRTCSREVREGCLEEGGQAESPELIGRSQAEQGLERLAYLQLLRKRTRQAHLPAGTVFSGHSRA